MLIIIAMIILSVAGASLAASSLPEIPKVMFGVNQYNVGLPADLIKHWPLTDDDAAFLKSTGCNTIRFPLYPHEVGIDERKLVIWNTGDKFNEHADGLKPDWRSLDALLDWMIKHQFTPFVCPVTEVKDDWSTKAWMSLHVPEQAQRTVWYTKLVVDHITGKYGDNVVYGWYENWFWNSYKHEKSAEFPAAFQRMLSKMYSGKITRLNAAWKTDYRSFDDIHVPVLMVEGKIPKEAINNIRTYDLRKAMDLMQREVLIGIRKHISKVAPNAVWTGGCMLGELGGLNDIRSVGIPRTNATIRTCAATSDAAAADLYGHKSLYHVFYRTVAKICAAERTRYVVAETAATKPETFDWVADAGGPTAGVFAWVGKEDAFGFIKWDGTRRRGNARKFTQLHEKLVSSDYAKYKPGHIRVYFPEETLYYSISERNHMDAYMHICQHVSPDELEPVLTDELSKLPAGTILFVLERTIPLRAIQELERLGDRVICPHSYLIDEFGDRHDRKSVVKDFYTKLLTIPDGKKLLDVFQRVEEKENNIAYRHYGTTISSPTEMADANHVVPGRPIDLSYLIDGSIYEGVTFADKQQKEVVDLKLTELKTLYGAFVQFYEGDGQDVAASALPKEIQISVSTDGVHYSETACVSGVGLSMRPHIRFTPIRARYIRFDFGENTRNNGLKIEELGVLGH